MKTNKIYNSLFCILLGSTMLSCGEPEQKFSVSVVNKNGEPVQNVEVKAWFKLPNESGGINDYSVSGLSDANGSIELSGQTVWAPTSVEARKEGHYPSMSGNHWTISRTTDNRWEPWPVEVDFIMKEIQNPIPMYALRCGSTKLFVFPDKEYGPHGFDLMAMDWVAPHGDGKVVDFILEGIRDDPEDQGSNPSGILRMTFSNPEDGIIEIDQSTTGGSLLRSPAIAPEKGYRKEWSFPNKINIEEQDDTMMLPEMVYVFRIRTKTDEKGNIIESHYGKIYGNIFAVLAKNLPAFSFTYYLNGTTNDRNLEWDMQNNLFENPPKSQWPRNL